jgi:hypothetical protein
MVMLWPFTLDWLGSLRSKGGWLSDERLGAVGALKAEEQQPGMSTRVVAQGRYKGIVLATTAERETDVPKA